MTKALDDILREPRELAGVLDRLLDGSDRAGLDRAAAQVRPGRTIYVAGIGSSWNAALAIATRLNRGGIPAIAADASELLHFAQLPADCLVIVLSRSGRSVEIVRLLDRFEAAGAQTVAITNTPDTPLSQRADTTIQLGAAFDHNVSFTMYSALALTGGLIAAQAAGEDIAVLAARLRESLKLAEAALPDWQARIARSPFFAPDAPAYFLARGESLASCHETRLLWEEVVKRPAAALPTGGFRHGSQEAVASGLRIGMWIHPEILSAEDLALAAEMREAGASLMVIGAGIPEGAADLVLPVPETPPGWQFLVDILPAQLAAEHLARAAGSDPDNFRFCSYVVEAEAGLTGRAA